ncbi:coiled-coil domain-containing protein SCD2-like protein isoform X2 [Tanacetum coccineum]|uniref:Coiled-coil domain-containing protein SCD2-like protein isoform X2 n=1 Tax=Tanacetum coccineum TaxID=301880 RepID=A0ABQ5HIT1_9ASTR
MHAEMDRGIKPVYVRDKSGTLGGASDGHLSPPTASSRGVASPMMQPRHGRSGSMIGNKSQNTKAAAQRLARMMSHQQTNHSEDDDDILSDYNPPTTTTPARSQIRPRSPMTVRTEQQHSAPRAASVGRSSQPLINHAGKIQSQSARSPFDQTSNSLESFSSNAAVEHVQPASARANRSSQLAHPVEQPSSARSVSVGRPSVVMKPVTMVPSSVSLSLRPTSSSGQGDSQTDNQKNKRLSLDLSTSTFRESGNQRTASISAPVSESASTSALQDEIDMLQEENESLLQKLRIAEERCEESEVRARQLEKQEGGSSATKGGLYYTRYHSLKPVAALRTAAAQNAAHNNAIRGGVIDALRLEAETAREEAASVMEQLHVTECEFRSLKTMTQRMVLTQEEMIIILSIASIMEELDLKRCWLARYWSLCVQHGIYAEIAGSRYEYWSSFAPLPVEVVLSAGQKAKAENSMVNSDKEQREKIPKDAGEVSVENMLLVERGLREMSLLKIEDALAFAMAQQRRLNRCAGNMELSKQESDDVLFKQAWLIYFWRRVKNHGLEPDIVDERLQFWINQGDHPPTSHDAVDVERGLVELRKLGIEAQLWQASRKLVDPDSEHKWQMHINF